MTACRSSPPTSNSSKCPKALDAIMACPQEDALCQLIAFVEYGQLNTRLNDVLFCFRRFNCTYVMADVSALGPMQEHRGAQVNLTDLDYLKGTWWTVAATSFIDALPCGSSLFQWNGVDGYWFNNETMQDGPGSFVHAYPPIRMFNGPGTYTTNYREVGWDQIENFTVVSKPSPYWMLLYYCGDDVLFGLYCGSLVLSRFRSFSAIPHWVNQTFKDVFHRLNISARSHHRGYDDIITVDSSNCTSNATPPQPMVWPDKFRASFVAAFDFESRANWDGTFYYDYTTKRSRQAHVRQTDGLACSYLFVGGVARIVGDGFPSSCCIDRSVPGWPTPPSLFHNFSSFDTYLTYNGVSTAVWRIADNVKYGVATFDGSPVFLKSVDFGGVWNFTTDFHSVSEFASQVFQAPSGCNEVCDMVPAARSNNCFFQQQASLLV
eukprot:TRINITY_DN37283_c0_g1_i1.p1 TRINITY_DN37283_c0_g1~~TRINITY_DN37283_c0_g1_i1.p1  ORF type:complete len:486 (+),score=51.96 TRINITY_DN37283_c0_g1_i1:157-1458(+)